MWTSVDTERAGEGRERVNISEGIDRAKTLTLYHKIDARKKGILRKIMLNAVWTQARRAHTPDNHEGPLCVCGTDNETLAHLWWRVERRSLVIFFFVSGVRTHVVATTVCATEGVHTLLVARISFWHTFLGVAHRHRARAWLEASAVRTSSLSILTFPPSLLLPHGHFETTFLSAQSLLDFTRSESAGPSALPHERRGVWLPGRTHALHMSFCLWTSCVLPCLERMSRSSLRW